MSRYCHIIVLAVYPFCPNTPKDKEKYDNLISNHPFFEKKPTIIKDSYVLFAGYEPISRHNVPLFVWKMGLFFKGLHLCF